MSMIPTPAKDWSDDLPRSVTKLVIAGFVLLVLTFGGFGLWAFRAPLAAAVLAPGSFVATGRNKVIQHLEGGIIEAILVNEGDSVRLGQPLVRLDQTAALANQRELMLRRARLEAIAARLRAQYEDADKVDLPEFLGALANEGETKAMIAEQLENFAASRRNFQSEIALLDSNIIANEARAKGFRDQLVTVQRQLALLQDDHEARSTLLDRGLVRRSEVNALARAMADADGEIARLQSQLDEADELSQKGRLQIEQARNENRQAALDQMQSIEAELESVREQSLKAQDVLARAEIVSPVAGTIVRLYYHTSGGVIEAGKPIVEVLPHDVPLIVEAQIPRTEVDELKLGQHVAIRLTSLNQRTTPVLGGKLVYVSADAIPTETDGMRREVYLARVDLPAEELRRVRGFTPTPGMPADVMIETQSRTFMQYLLKPISDSLSRAFLEN